MTISAFHSGVNMLHQAQNMATSGAKNIQQSTLVPSSSPEQALPASASRPAAVPSPDEVITQASTDLLQAQTYNQAGANVVRRANEMTGSLLNIKV